MNMLDPKDMTNEALVDAISETTEHIARCQEQLNFASAHLQEVKAEISSRMDKRRGPRQRAQEEIAAEAVPLSS